MSVSKLTNDMILSAGEKKYITLDKKPKNVMYFLGWDNNGTVLTMVSMVATRGIVWLSPDIHVFYEYTPDDASLSLTPYANLTRFSVWG